MGGMEAMLPVFAACLFAVVVAVILIGAGALVARGRPRVPMAPLYPIRPLPDTRDYHRGGIFEGAMGSEFSQQDLDSDEGRPLFGFDVPAGRPLASLMDNATFGVAGWRPRSGRVWRFLLAALVAVVIACALGAVALYAGLVAGSIVAGAAAVLLVLATVTHGLLAQRRERLAYERDVEDGKRRREEYRQWERAHYPAALRMETVGDDEGEPATSG